MYKFVGVKFVYPNLIFILVSVVTVAAEIIICDHFNCSALKGDT